MENRTNPFNLTLLFIVYGITFLFPLIFLPITREFVIYTKFYFLIAGVLALMIVSLAKFLFTRKFHWVQHPGLQALALIVLAYALSIILMTPNKIQAIFNPQYGLVMIIAFIIYYVYASYEFYKSTIRPAVLLAVSGLIVSLISLIMLVEPLRNVPVPAYWAFLQNSAFNTIGTSVHLVTFLVFALVGTGTYLWRLRSTGAHDKDKKSIMMLLGVVVLFIVLGLIFSLYSVIDSVMNKGAQLVLPPFNLSWYAAVEVLKNPMTAIFGIGSDNFAALYPQVRTITYNSSALWQINTFALSRSAILQILTEVGILGLAGISLLIYQTSKLLKKVTIESSALFITAVVILAFFPASIISFFMFFFSLAAVAADLKRHAKTDEYEIDLSRLTPAYIGLVAVYIVVIGASGMYLWTNFMSEYYYKMSLDAVAENDLPKLYDRQAKAVQLNNYNEEFRRNFSQTNLLLANNIAAKPANTITDQDRQTIAQAIQASIQEAKAGVALNPQKVTNWQNLASVYRQIINVAENAPVWAISTYQQAIIRDPRNPALRLDLGGIFYLFQNYGEAQRLFEQAVALKPDWSNAHYNLAWAYYQQGFYQPAVEQMQLVVGIIDPAAQPEDYKKSQKELETFKEKLASAQTKQAEQTEVVPEETELNLPTPPAAAVEPKIELPQDASPEAEPVKK